MWIKTALDSSINRLLVVIDSVLISLDFSNNPHVDSRGFSDVEGLVLLAE